MGFREYNPGLSRYLSRDYYDGALKDLALGTDPWNTNRYAFAGGNPITGIELDGHYTIDENGDRISPDTPIITSPGTTGSPQVPTNVGQHINESVGLPAGASQQRQAIRLSQMGVPPAVAGLNLGAAEFNKTGLPEAMELVADVTGAKDAQDCAAYFGLTACGMTALSVIPIGKLAKAAKAAAALKHADDAAGEGVIERTEVDDACRSHVVSGPSWMSWVYCGRRQGRWQVTSRTPRRICLAQCLTRRVSGPRLPVASLGIICLSSPLAIAIERERSVGPWIEHAVFPVIQKVSLDLFEDIAFPDDDGLGEVFADDRVQAAGDYCISICARLGDGLKLDRQVLNDLLEGAGVLNGVSGRGSYSVR